MEALTSSPFQVEPAHSEHPSVWPVWQGGREIKSTPDLAEIVHRAQQHHTFVQLSAAAYEQMKSVRAAGDELPDIVTIV